MHILTNYAAEFLLLIFLIITFLQSGLDKITDWKGNLSWLKEHFSKTFFKNMVPFLLGTILLVELIAAFLCSLGIYQLAFLNNGSMALYGAITSCIALLMLLFGQRIAKDYDGARTIVIYFIPAVILVFILQL